MAIGNKLPVIMGVEKGATNGVATLNENGILSNEQRPNADGIFLPDGITSISTALANKASLDAQNELKANIFSYRYRNIHVAKTGSDETGNGSANAPYLTIQHAVDSLPKFLSGRTIITIHAGAYEEDVTINSFAGAEGFFLMGAEGEAVQIKSINARTANLQVTLQNFEVTGELSGGRGNSIDISGIQRVEIIGIKCTAPQSEGAVYGAIRATNSTVSVRSTTVSNKKIAFDVVNAILYLDRTDTGENNEVAIQCGSGSGGCGGFVQKGGAAIAGTEQTIYGGQIF